MQLFFSSCLLSLKSNFFCKSISHFIGDKQEFFSFMVFIMNAVSEETVSAAANKRAKIKKQVIFSAYELGRIVDTSIDYISPQLELKSVDNLFNLPDTSEFLPVVEGEADIIGYIKKDKFKAKLGQNHFARDIFLKDGVSAKIFTDTDVVVLDSYQNLSEASHILMARDIDHLYDPFVITHEGKYFGVGTVKKVMDGINYYQKKDFQASQEAQQSIMASEDTAPEKYNVEFSVHNQQLGMVGGDYVYHRLLNPQLSLFILMDVCGKGLKASNMLMAIGSFIKRQFDLPAQQLQAADYKNLGLVAMINRLNRLVALNTPSDMYATGVILLFDSKHQVLQYMNYGHTDIFLARGSKALALPSEENIAEGMFPFFGIEPNLVMKSKKIRIQPRDLFFVFTDGVNEARNSSKEEFGEERIQAFLAKHHALNTQELNALLVTSLEDFKEGYRTIDDTSMVSMRIL